MTDKSQINDLAQEAGMRREEAIAEAYRRFPDVVEPIPEHPKGRIAVDRGNIRYAFVEGALYAAQPPAAPVETAIMEATEAQHIIPRQEGRPAQFTRNGKLETCQCGDCRRLSRPESK